MVAQVAAGEGNDTLADADTFVYNTALDTATNVDGILDYAVADDTIELDSAIFFGVDTRLAVGGRLVRDRRV